MAFNCSLARPLPLSRKLRLSGSTAAFFLEVLFLNCSADTHTEWRVLIKKGLEVLWKLPVLPFLPTLPVSPQPTTHTKITVMRAHTRGSCVHQTAPCPLLAIPSQFLELLFFPPRPHLLLPPASHFPAAYLSPCHHFSPSFMPFCLKFLLSFATSSSFPHLFFFFVRAGIRFVTFTKRQD